MTNIHKAAREALEACETALRHFTKTPSTLADSTARGNAHAALATLRAALEAPGEEREAFKAWYVLKAFDYARDPIGSRDYALQWAAWQARAMLAARPSAPTVALPEKQRYRCGDCRHADSWGIPQTHGCQLACHYEPLNAGKEGGA